MNRKGSCFVVPGSDFPENRIRRPGPILQDAGTISALPDGRTVAATAEAPFNGLRDSVSTGRL